MQLHESSILIFILIHSVLAFCIEHSFISAVVAARCAEIIKHLYCTLTFLALIIWVLFNSVPQFLLLAGQTCEFILIIILVIANVMHFVSLLPIIFVWLFLHQFQIFFLTLGHIWILLYSKYCLLLCLGTANNIPYFVQLKAGVFKSFVRLDSIVGENFIPLLIYWTW